MKNLGIFIFWAAVVIHLAIYFTGRYNEAERYTDANARLDYNAFLSRLLEVMPTPFAYQIPDSTYPTEVNRVVILKRILPSILNYKYTIDINEVISDQEKSDRTQDIITRTTELRTDDEGFTFTSYMLDEYLELNKLQYEYHDQERNTRRITLIVFIVLYVSAILLFFIGRRREKAST